MFLHRLSHAKAPEFPNKLEWLQGGPLSLRKLRGKVVLVDFWTYSCVNCIRTQAMLNRWHKLYAEHGLVIVGVHTPEFAFEKEPKNVERAMLVAEIDYPVVLDPDYELWHAYGNQYWPRKYVVDHEGYIVYDHIGEGGYAETEMALQKALIATGAKNLPLVPPDEAVGGAVCYRTTPEVYLGFLRGELGNRENYLPDAEQIFADVAKHAEDRPYVYGHWTVRSEFIEHSRKLSVANEYLLLKYSAFAVNLILGTSDGRTAVIELELDGKPLPKDLAGEDVRITRDGRATVTVKEHRLYQLVNAAMYHRATLKIKTASGNVQLFAFTFRGCDD
ncbi:MAG: redoxin domain-containing protein [Patescibacteria group bacterium]